MGQQPRHHPHEQRPVWHQLQRGMGLHETVATLVVLPDVCLQPQADHQPLLFRHEPVPAGPRPARPILFRLRPLPGQRLRPRPYLSVGRPALLQGCQHTDLLPDEHAAPAPRLQCRHLGENGGEAALVDEHRFKGRRHALRLQGRNHRRRSGRHRRPHPGNPQQRSRRAQILLHGTAAQVEYGL